MATDRITIRIDPALRRELEERASAKGKRESEVVREALREFLPLTELARLATTWHSEQA